MHGWCCVPAELRPQILDLLSDDAGQVSSLRRVCWAWRVHVQVRPAFADVLFQDLLRVTHAGCALISVDLPASYQGAIAAWVREPREGLPQRWGSLDCEVRPTIAGRLWRTDAEFRGEVEPPWRSEGSSRMRSWPDRPEQRVDDRASRGDQEGRARDEARGREQFHITMAVYVEARRRYAMVKAVLAWMRELLCCWETLWEAMYGNSPRTVFILQSVAVLVFGPQAILWLALRVDGVVNCHWAVGGCLGLSACFVLMFAKLCVARAALHIFVANRRLLRTLGPHWCEVTDADPTILRLPELMLLSAVMWLCALGSLSGWLFLLLVLPTQENLLIAAAALNCVPAAVTTACLVRASKLDMDTQLSQLYLKYTLLCTWLFVGLEFVRCSDGFVGLEFGHCSAGLVLAVGATIPCLITFGFDMATRLYLFVSSLPEAFGLTCARATKSALFVSLSLLVYLYFLFLLLVAAGRCGQANWAYAVPIWSFTVPFQLPLVLLLVVFPAMFVSRI